MNNAVATDFLAAYVQRWQPGWWLNLCAIQPDNAAPLVGRSWPAAEVAQRRDEISAWIAEQNAAGRGLYFTTNPLARSVNSKPADADVAAVVALNIDADPDVSAHGGYDAARAALAQAVKTRDMMSDCAPSFSVDSGNGVGLFLALAEPVDAATGKRAGLVLQAEARRLKPGAKVDSTADPARLMRLPGTRNWPSMKKQARGYPGGDAAPWASIRAKGGGRLAPEAVAALAAAWVAPTRADPASVSQGSLRAPSAERFAALVADLPNPEEVGREMWVDVLRAMRAAAADLLDDAGEEAARQWSALHPSHDDSRFDAAWRSVAGPSSLGWEMLVNKGKQWGSSVAADESCLADFAALALLAPANDTAAPDGSRRFGRLRLLSVHDAINAPPRRHLLKPLLAPGELSVWWGAPKSGKSFLLLRLVYGLALGQGMWGMKARRACRVLYVAAEGEGGFKARVLALQRQLGDAGDGFAFVAQSVVIGKPGTDVPAVVAAAQATGADLVVVDTLARTFGAGDENTAQDMGVFITALDRIREMTGAHVAVIHHGSKEGRSARGSGALIGAADLVVNIAKGASGDPNTASVEAAKDDADGGAMAFRLVPVGVGFDEDGAPITTCIAEETTTTRRRAPKLPKQAQAALKALYETVQAEGEALPSQPGFPNDFRGTTEERWRRECDAVRISTAEDAKSRAKAFSRAFDALREAGCIETRDGWVWQPPGDIS